MSEKDPAAGAVQSEVPRATRHLNEFEIASKKKSREVVSGVHEVHLEFEFDDIGNGDVSKRQEAGV